MPGILSHVIAGSAMFIIGSYYYHSYFEGDDKIKKLFYLAIVCLLFSFIPDFLLGIYYSTRIFSRCSILPYHNLFHTALIPIAIIGLLTIYILKPKRKPIWIMGLWSIVLHIAIDYFIHTKSFWI